MQKVLTADRPFILRLFRKSFTRMIYLLFEFSLSYFTKVCCKCKHQATNKLNCVPFYSNRISIYLSITFSLRGLVLQKHKFLIDRLSFSLENVFNRAMDECDPNYDFRTKVQSMFSMLYTYIFRLSRVICRRCKHLFMAFTFYDFVKE